MSNAGWRRRFFIAAVLASVVLSGATACSSSGNDKSAEPATTTSTSATTTTRPRPAGPTANFSREVEGGKGVYIGSATPANVQEVGYVEREYFAEGSATSYQAAGALTRNGRWKFVPDTRAPYRTRVLVRAPADPNAFSGTVIVEWINVSGGVDTDADWVTLREEILRAGDVWVGVSAQRIGIEGGPVRVKAEGIPGAEAAGKGLKAMDPARYGTLDHPGDGYSFDIFTQAARAVGTGSGLNGLQPQRLIAAGQSQSAVALTTYYNGVQPLARAFDAFFVHSRFAASLPLAEPGQHADLGSAIGGSTRSIFRTDQDAPILDVQTETDVASLVNSYAVRQPDSDRFRLWEVAGTAHADEHIVGPHARLLDCGVPINNGPLHLVAKAALRALTEWIETGTAPVIAPRLDVIAGATPQMRRNADAIALGGIRTPVVDVPVAVASGAPGPNPSTICFLLGSMKPLSATRLAELYPSRAEYVQRYEAGADAAIKSGFVLPEDRAALLAFAEPDRITS